MALSTIKGSFTKSVGGAPASQAITGLTFLPKVILLWATLQTAAGTAADLIIGWGISDATTDFAVCQSSEDNVSPSNANLVMASKALTITDNGGTVVAECDMTSFDDNGGGDFGFTVNWTTNDGNAYIIHYFCIGGSDLNRQTVGTFAAPGASGTQAVTGVGFQADCLIFITSERTAVGSSVNAAISFGFAVSSTKRGAMCGYSEDNSAAADAARRQYTSNCIVYVGDKGGTPSDYGIADFVSMDSDGFTLDWDTIPNTTFLIGYIALKGGQYHIGSETAPTAGAPQSQAITGVGFTPTGVIFASTASGDITLAIDNIPGLGAASGAGVEGWAMGLDNDAANPTEANSRTLTTKAMSLTVDANEPVFIQHECDLTSFDSDGFTLNWTTTAAQSNLYLYLAMGNQPAAGAQEIMQTVYY